MLILSNKIINYEFEIFDLRDLGMTFRDLRFKLGMTFMAVLAPKINFDLAYAGVVP